MVPAIDPSRVTVAEHEYASVGCGELKQPIPGGASCIRYVMRPRFNATGTAVTRLNGSRGSAGSRYAKLVQWHGSTPADTRRYSERGSRFCCTATTR